MGTAKSKNFTNESIKDSLITATVWANLTQFLRIIVITLVLNWQFGLKLFIPISGMLLFLLIVILWDRLKKKDPKSAKSDGAKDKELDSVKINFKSPFTFKPAITFALLFMFVTIFTKIALYFVGNSGFIISSIISAISGLDAITINTVNFAGKIVSYELGMVVLVIAACVNLFIKMIFVSSTADEYFSKKMNWIFMLTVIIGIVLMFATILI